MKALLYEAPGRVALLEVLIPEIGETEALVEVEACGVCGTDLHKVFDSNLKPPVPLGHEVAGRIARVGRKVKGFKAGDRVVVAHHVPCGGCHYCRKGSETMCRDFKRSNLDPGGFAQFTRITEGHLARMTLKLPKGLAPEEACQTEPLACCLRLVRRLGLGQGDLAVVVGLGAIGLMTAQALKVRGAKVLGLDLDPGRVRLAQKVGVAQAYTGKDGRAEEIIRNLTVGRGADALVFTAGTPALVAERLPWLRDGGVLSVFGGFYPQSKALIDLNDLYSREISVVQSYSPAPQDLREAMELIASGAVSMEPYVRGMYPLELFQEAARQVRGREVLKAIIMPKKADQGSPRGAAPTGRRTSVGARGFPGAAQ